MAEIQEVAVPRSGSAYRFAPSIVPPELPSAEVNLAAQDWTRSNSLALSEARRAWNRDLGGPGSELRCECRRPNCTETLPATAETHRRVAGRFVVAPAHFDGVVVSAADRFFVVERPGEDVRRSDGEAK